MAETPQELIRPRPLLRLVGILVVVAVLGTVLVAAFDWYATPQKEDAPLRYSPRREMESSGIEAVTRKLKPWKPDASLEEIRQVFQRTVDHEAHALEEFLARSDLSDDDRIQALLDKARIANYDGKPRQAYQFLHELRSLVQGKDTAAEKWLYTIIYYQGVTALRCGETENCVLCRGESSCILPISAAAVHTDPRGSRQAIGHFTEYLEQFPDDLAVCWLLNLAHMTLDEHPAKVDPRYLISLERFRKTEFDIGKFRDVGGLVGVSRLNQAGGAI